MKILGETQNGFIVEAHRDELYNLIGFSWYGAAAPGIVLKVGDEIRVAAMYKALNSLAHNKQRADQVREALTAIADSLVLIDPVLDAVTPDDKGRGHVSKHS